MVFLNFSILEKINKTFIPFFGLLNKSRFGISSDDCVWGFTISYTQLSYFSTNMRKNFVNGKNWLFSSRNFLFTSPLSPSFLSLQFTFFRLFTVLLSYIFIKMKYFRPKQNNKLYSTVVTEGGSVGANLFQILSL